MTFQGRNQGSTQTKTIAITIAVIVTVLIINSWMGKEMNNTVGSNPLPIQPAEPIPEKPVVPQTATVAPEHVQEQEKVITPPVPKSPAPEEEKIEPVYDTPSTDVILVQ